MKKIIILSCFLLGSCQTILETTSTKDDGVEKIYTNRDTVALLKQVIVDVNNAIAAGAEWRIRDKATDNKAVSFSELLNIAKEFQTLGEIDEAHRLARKISQLVALALKQFQDNQDALPKYLNQD